MEELETQITDEVAAITGFLEQQFGRQSRWNGEVELSDDPTAFGKARWSGRINLNRQLAQTDSRWRTLIHAALHHLSVGLSVPHYLNLPGWEEGVVEQLQRVLRNDLLTLLGIGLPVSVFVAIEDDHQFNRYIEALETVRLALNLPMRSFYEDLLATPLKDRPGSLVEASRRLPVSNFREFQRVFAAAFSILRGD